MGKAAASEFALHSAVGSHDVLRNNHVARQDHGSGDGPRLRKNIENRRKLKLLVTSDCLLPTSTGCSVLWDEFGTATNRLDHIYVQCY
eukprot:2353622-Pleurochrysis_carterae.AAC.3